MTALKKLITFIAFILVAWGSYNLGKATWCVPDQKIADSPNRSYFDTCATSTPQTPPQPEIKPTQAQEWPVTAYYNTDPASHDFTFRWDGAEDGKKFNLCSLGRKDLPSLPYDLPTLRIGKISPKEVWDIMNANCFEATAKGKSGSLETISMSKNFFDYFADPREGKVKLIIKELK